MGTTISIIATVVALMVAFKIFKICYKWKHTIMEPYRTIFWIFVNQITHDQMHGPSSSKSRDFADPMGYAHHYCTAIEEYNSPELLKYLGTAYGWKMFKWAVAGREIYYLVGPTGLCHWCYYNNPNKKSQK